MLKQAYDAGCELAIKEALEGSQIRDVDGNVVFTGIGPDAHKHMPVFMATQILGNTPAYQKMKAVAAARRASEANKTASWIGDIARGSAGYIGGPGMRVGPFVGAAIGGVGGTLASNAPGGMHYVDSTMGAGVGALGGAAGQYLAHELAPAKYKALAGILGGIGGGVLGGINGAQLVALTTPEE